MENYTWIKIKPKGNIPSPRAAHAACKINNEHLAMFGGTNENGDLVPDDLYILKIPLENENYIWYKIQNDGSGPGMHYGHNIIYNKPYLYILGGSLEDKYSNIVNYTLIDENNIYQKIKWNILKIEENSLLPPPRIYQTCSICKFGNNVNQIFLYGGRDEKGIPLNDCWELKKNDTLYEWIKIEYKDGYKPEKRFQHTSIFFYNFLIVIGGRTFPENEKIPIEIFDVQTYKWIKTEFLNKFRHSNWILGDFIYIQGGFNLFNPNYALSEIIKIDLVKLFNSNDFIKSLFLELQKNLNKQKERNKYLLFDNEKQKKEEDKQIKIQMSIDKNEKKDIKYDKPIKDLKNKYNKTVNSDYTRFMHSYPIKRKNTINVKFISVDQNINYLITCEEDQKFHYLEDLLYDKYPDYIDSENYFMVNGIKINRNKTLKDNKIKNGSTIVLKKIDEEDFI